MKLLFRTFFIRIGLSYLSILLVSCGSLDAVLNGFLPKQSDAKRFVSREIKKSDSVFHFYKTKNVSPEIEKIGLTSRILNAHNASIDEFIKDHNTEAFLIIRNDTILYEYYESPSDSLSKFSSFSMVKPMISTLIGIAIDENKIGSVEDPLTTYLKEYKSIPGWDKIKIKHLLHHTSGIKFNSSIDNLRYYWGRSIRKNLLKVKLDTTPDAIFNYSSINTLLLGRILEEVSQTSISQYFEEKLWKQLGMESSAYWSLDSGRENAIEKAFCCLQARTVDFAKFGRLYLNEGLWNGKQILSKSWIKYSTFPDYSGNNRHYYNNNWGLGPKEYGSFFAVGLYGQYIYVHPEKKILIVRIGDKVTSYHPNYWNSIFIQLVDQL
jgi:CubicO group peptidase (beta-lactamase class C family)